MIDIYIFRVLQVIQIKGDGRIVCNGKFYPLFYSFSKPRKERN